MKWVFVPRMSKFESATHQAANVLEYNFWAIEYHSIFLRDLVKITLES